MSRTPSPILSPQGDSALTVSFPGSVDAALTRHVLAIDRALNTPRPKGVIETVPAYCSVTLHLDPLTVDLPTLSALVLQLAAQPTPSAAPERLWEVPVVYGGGFGCDLEEVATQTGMTPQAVLEAHTTPEYQVAMVGYLPGFSYLSGLDPRLALPRRADPRATIPASSISIGGQQTAIGSLPGPSGWHLIGRTPVRPYQKGRSPSTLFGPGDRIRFVPIAPSDWDDLDRAADQGAPVARQISP